MKKCLICGQQVYNTHSEKECMEKACEAVHKAYCDYYYDTHGKEYWSKGDYNKLDEGTKEIDRRTVTAVLSFLNRVNDGGFMKTIFRSGMIVLIGVWLLGFFALFGYKYVTETEVKEVTEEVRVGQVWIYNPDNPFNVESRTYEVLEVKNGYVQYSTVGSEWVRDSSVESFLWKSKLLEE